MFVVLYGLTGEIGHRARAHFAECGFKKMDKIYYFESDEERKSVEAEGYSAVSSPKELEALCDYSYRVNKRLIGFNKKDFDRAASGAEDMFTSVACSDIEFLKNLKADYGDYITLIYVYFDDSTIKNAIYWLSNFT